MALNPTDKPPTPNFTLRRPLGQTGLHVSPIGFGSFKLGRNQGIKYPSSYDLPTQEQAAHILNAVLDMGINLIDTAPAYGLAEERIGQAIAHRRDEYILTSKAGEHIKSTPSSNPQSFESYYDFSYEAITQSIEQSLKRLNTSHLDIALIHSDGRDEYINLESGAPQALIDLKQRGLVRYIGHSGKTAAGNALAITTSGKHSAWADVLMIEYHAAQPQEEQHAAQQLITQAQQQGVGVLIKKGLASGHLPAESAIEFILKHPGVSSLVLGGLNLEHIKANLNAANISN